MDEGANVVHIQCGHVFDSPGGFLESSQTYVKVDLIQVSAIKCIQLETVIRRKGQLILLISLYICILSAVFHLKFKCLQRIIPEILVIKKFTSIPE